MADEVPGRADQVPRMRDERLDGAFEAWLQAQTAALDVVRTTNGVTATDIEIAEGDRWATRLSRLALDWIVERSDPLHPQLFVLQDEYRKLLVDNPDVHSLFCVLDDTRSYRLTGYRGECAYLGMTFGNAFGPHTRRPSRRRRGPSAAFPAARAHDCRDRKRAALAATSSRTARGR
jgi:hypothetical protein